MLHTTFLAVYQMYNCTKNQTYNLLSVYKLLHCFTTVLCCRRYYSYGLQHAALARGSSLLPANVHPALTVVT